MDFLMYLFKGFAHWLYLLLSMLDFKDIGFMWIILLGVIVLALLNKSIKESLLISLVSLFNVTKKAVGLIFLMLFIAYYIYIGIFFEEKISILILIVSIWLLVNDYVKTNLNLLSSSKNGIIDSIKEISIPILLLYIQQLILMFENSNFNNILFVNLSLLFIPIYSLLFFVLKHYINCEDIYVKYKSKLKFDGFYFMKIFNESLIESGNYKINRQVLEDFLKNNILLGFEDMKAKLILELPQLVNKYKLKEKKNIKEKTKFSKVKKVFNVIWLLNIICLIDYVISVRFFSGNFNFLYYFCFIVLAIYMWTDLMKVKRIENKSDFITYSFIYIVLIVFIVIYASTLNVFRLSELGFIIPILIIIHLKYINKKFPNFITIPNFSENNFFGMSMEQYYNSLNKKKK